MSPVRFSMITLLLATVFLVCTVSQGWAQSPFPDGVRFVDTGMPIRAGQNYTITLQVLLDGGDYPRGNIGIFLETDNNSVFAIPEPTMAVTNQSGVAQYNVTSDQVKPGTAKVTAILLDRRTGAKVSKSYTIAQTGNLNGTVADMAGVAIPGSSVTLYQVVNGTNQQYLVEGNPTVTTGNDTGTPGSFEFAGISYGSYYLEAAMADKTTGVNYTLNEMAQPVYIVLAGYSVVTPTPAPTVTPEPTTSTSASPTTMPTHLPTQTSGDSGKQVLWIGGLAIILAIIFLAIVALTRKK